MSSLITQALVFERYGARLTTDDLANILRLDRGTVLNQISGGTLGIPTYKDGRQRYADFRDVAAYLDQKRDEAQSARLPV